MASNRNVLKRYAPQARLDFIQAVTNRAAQFGITKDGNASGEIQGDLFILNGKAFPRSVANQRGRLISQVANEGFGQVMEAVAYTWFNRLLAIRYMEVHNYFDHGCRVLSNPNGDAEPEILEKAASIDLPGVDRDEIVNLKLDGTKDEQIYRKLLIAQCNDLHRAMPFLFEKIDDETELLLPENLLQSDSIVRKLVNEIDESEWQEIEIIGWLYQFYISEKKDQVIGKVVKSEDIPAATQLFTPNWIVKYMVQNSLGAQWLATYPDSGIRSDMEYYIAPAEQTAEVQAQIDAITPKELDPEAITLIDPAVGSGHILVEAYDLFRAIYLERGYTKREAARAILTKNLFGLDIDKRAAQMAGFALLMKASADDRSVLRNPPHLNVLALQDSGGLNADELTKALLPQERFEMVPSGDLWPDTVAQPTLAAKQPTSPEATAITALVKLFDGAKTFGSLITVPDAVMQSLPLLDALLTKPLTGDLYLRQAQEDAQEALKPLVEQARLLGGCYDCVVANPPYLGSKGMNPDLKSLVQREYRDSKTNTFATFIERGIGFGKSGALVSLVTLQGWMTLSSYESLRSNILTNCAIENMIHLGPRAFDSIGGEVVSTVSFVLNKNKIRKRLSNFIRLVEGSSENEKVENLSRIIGGRSAGLYTCCAESFFDIPGNPISYWISPVLLSLFSEGRYFGDIASPRVGMQTANNDKFLRFWWEVVSSKTSAFNSQDPYWISYSKGGSFRKWWGNNEYVLYFKDGGFDLKNQNNATLPDRSIYNAVRCTWTDIGGESPFGARLSPIRSFYDIKGHSFFPSEIFDGCLSVSNSSPFNYALSVISVGLNYQVGDVKRVPVPLNWEREAVSKNERVLIAAAQHDWDDRETSWDFGMHPLCASRETSTSLATTYDFCSAEWSGRVAETRRLEEENNRLFIEAYGLQDELTPDVPLSEITLTCNPHYRYGGDLTDEEREARLKSDTMRELISYAVGCMMGRYSLAEPGLIYAHSGGVGFDPSRYGSFPADADGIVPLTEEQWFADDAAARIEEFLGIAWPEAPIMETMTTLMDGLSMGKAGEPRAALRSYLSKQFYKDHLQTYKNRPIYWLFSSGKQKAFEALVYLHRYNEGTLARMRTVYVTPLMGKLQQRITDLDAEIAVSSSSAEKTRKTREKDKLAKQLVELRQFDEELRHLADQRIAIDLDDGVKVNYGRFGNLLAAKEKVIPKGKGGDE